MRWVRFSLVETNKNKLQSYPLVSETLLEIHWFYKMKSRQIRKHNYQMNIIFQKEKEKKFTLLEAMSFHSEVWFDFRFKRYMSLMMLEMFNICILMHPTMWWMLQNWPNKMTQALNFMIMQGGKST